MALQHFTIEAVAPATPAAVWALLGDSRTWPDWTPLDSVDILESVAGDGPGEERLVRNGRHRIRERIVEREPPRRLSYSVESGLAVRGYRAVVSLTPVQAGDAQHTRVTWDTSFAAKVPGLGSVYKRALEKATRAFVAGLVDAATP